MSRTLRILGISLLLGGLNGVVLAQAEHSATPDQLVPAPPTNPVLGGATPAIVSWTGGSEFAIFYGGSTGDVVGFRFMMNSEMAVESLGVWANDSTVPGLTSDHMVGIWDDTMTLIASTTVTPASPMTGDFRYEAIAPVNLSTGTLYTIGALYTATDDDAYVSSAANLVTDPAVSFQGAVFPSVGDLGFVFPTEDSGIGSQGRFGPNFILGPPVSTAPIIEVPTLGIPGILLMLLILGAMATMVLRRRQA